MNLERNRGARLRVGSGINGWGRVGVGNVGREVEVDWDGLKGVTAA